MRIPALPRLVLGLAITALAVSCGDTPTRPAPEKSTEENRPENGVRLFLVSGDSQAGQPGKPLAAPIVVRVVDVNDRPVASATLNFLVMTGGGSAAPAQAQTDSTGTARTVWTLGAALGAQSLRVAGTGGTLLVATATAALPAVASVRIQPDSLRVAPGERAAFTASAFAADGQALAGRAVSWASLDTLKATVDAQGVVTGKADGSVRITATVEGVTDEAVVHVRTPPAPVVRVRIQPDSLVLDPGRTGDFSAFAYDAAGNVLTGRPVAWTSDQARVATVDGRGTVTASAEGTARITATVEGVAAHAQVRVRGRIAVAQVRVRPDSAAIVPGARFEFAAVAFDAHGSPLTGRPVRWSSSDTLIARVDASGTATGVRTGSVRISATVEGVTGHAQLHVRQAVLPTVSVPLIQKRVVSTGGFIDVTRQGVTLAFWIHTSAPVDGVSLRIRSPAGRLIDCGTAGAENYFMNEFRCYLDIAAGSEAGLWRVDRVRVTRGADTRTFSAAHLDEMGTNGRAFDVLGSGSDTRPPEVRTVVPERRSSGYYWLKFALVDHVSGVRSASATVRNVDTGQRLTCSARSSYGELARIGDYYCPLDVPQGSRWTVESITATDAGGHTATYTPQQIAVWRGVFEVTFIDFDFTA